MNPPEPPDPDPEPEPDPEPLLLLALLPPELLPPELLPPELLLPEFAPPLTDWPTEPLTATTVPAAGAVSLVCASACSALITLAWSEATDASSDSTCPAVEELP